MEKQLPVIADFVISNRDVLATYVRRELIEAGAKPYLDQLGKAGIRAKQAEAAGMLLDLACNLLRKLDPSFDYDSQEILENLPDHLRSDIRLPRSDEYHRVMDELAAMVRRREPNQME